MVGIPKNVPTPGTLYTVTIAVSATADVAPAVSSAVSRPHTFGGSPSSATSGHGITSTSYTFAIECAPKLHSVDFADLFDST